MSGLPRSSMYADVIAPFPPELMNRSVSPTLLNVRQQARWVENFLPSTNTAGAGKARFGLAPKGNATTANITDAFEYRTSAGAIQIITAWSDGTLRTLNEGTGAYTTIKTGLDALGTLRAVQFASKLIFVNGINTPFSWNGTSCVDLGEYVADQTTKTRAWVAANQVSIANAARGTGDYPNGRSVRLVITGTGLAISSITRASSTATVTTTANHNLPNGTTVTIAGASQAEYNGTFVITVTGANTFTYTVTGTPVTPATGTITYGFNNVTITTTTTGATINASNLLTITLAASVLPAASVTINSISYFVNPPAFSDVYAEHNRLWALSSGELKASTYRGTDGLKVFYTDATNNENAWYNQSGATPTQELNFVNLLNKAGQFDELVKISSFNGNMVFVGREQIYIYSGDDPTTVGGFVWQKTIPVGCVHGNLVIQFPNDMVFFTKFGARSLSSVFRSEKAQVSADIGSAVDRDVSQRLQTLLSSDANYKKARSFFYDRDGFYGFKLDDSYMLCFALSDRAKGWFYLSGLFSSAQAFLATSDGRLMVGNGLQLYVYGNGSDAVIGTVYSDNGAAIKLRWWTPWIQGRNGWRNNEWLLITDETPNASVNLKRFKDYDEGNSVTSTFVMFESGPYWGEADWDEDFWTGDNNVVYRKRDQFKCTSFSFLLEADLSVGPFAVLGVKAIGG